MANKKTFDREKMYRKIMPTYYDNNFALATDSTQNLPDFDDAIDDNNYNEADNGSDFMESNDFEEESFPQETRSTIVSFPSPSSHHSSHSGGHRDGDVKSAIRQAVRDTVDNLNKDDVELSSEKSQPTPAFGRYGEDIDRDSKSHMQDSVAAPAPKANSFRKTSEIERLREQHQKVGMVNLTEKVILEKLDVVMENMNCCRCDRCKMDVIALTLNHMEPYYVVRSESNSADYTKVEKELADKATAEVLKAVLKVRKNPRH